MKSDNTLLVSLTDTFPFESKAFHVGYTALLAIQIIVASGAVDVSLQGSCDDGNSHAGRGVEYGVTNWTDITGSLKSLGAGDDLLYDVEEMGYKWIRILVDGYGSLTARINTKG